MENENRFPFFINGFKVPLAEQVRPENDDNMTPYRRAQRRTDHLPKGWQKTPERRPILCDILFDQHIPVQTRDGVTLYIDVLRPDYISERVPALLAVSPYGKGGLGFQILENCPFRLGIKENFTSGLEKFESVDPGDWCSRGYAIINVDIRGSWDSEGDLPWEGRQCGLDVYDVVEFVAQMEWCSGSVGMQGNSWLATSQWFGAIENPPHLKAIAPWEGFIDMYRQTCCRGGIPNEPFFEFIRKKTIRGRQLAEDASQALRQWPLYNAYWDDKSCRVEKITIPMYVLASYGSAIHGFGTIDAWKRASSKEKWLRIHGTQEWWDLYTPAANADLQKFFDKYLKGFENDWAKTAPVRVSILSMKPAGMIENQPEIDYPIPRTKYRKFYLTKEGLDASPPKTESSTTYTADDYDATAAEFTFKFDKTTTLVGYSKVRLWVSSIEHDDLDVYVSVRKSDRNGKLLEHINVPYDALPDTVKSQDNVPNANVIKYLGPTGVLRASHRYQDSSKSTDMIPYHPHDRVEKISPGTATLLEIGLWPMGIWFEEGESLDLRIRGHIDQYPEFPQHVEGKPRNLNKGKHTIYFGGQYDSSLIVPIV